MKKKTIKQEALYYLQCQGYTASDQDIQRAIWRDRKRRGGVTGLGVSSYLLFNKIARPIKPDSQVSTAL
ncbi:MAG: hypothetical protein KDD15_13910 [Lewinella sp.]|nr:hypothetical protein [Lewinella sp.]